MSKGADQRVWVCRAPPPGVSPPRPPQMGPLDVLEVVHIPDMIMGNNVGQFGTDLSPAKLCDAQGTLIENVWQFCALYSHVSAQQQKWTQWMQRTEWHIGGEQLNANAAYWEWRARGMAHKIGVNDVGGDRLHYIGHIWPKDATPAAYEILPHAEAKKRIYCTLYKEALLDRGQSKSFTDMNTALYEQGRYLLIMGPAVSFTVPQLVTAELVQKHLAQRGSPIQCAIVVAALLLNKPEWLLS